MQKTKNEILKLLLDELGGDNDYKYGVEFITDPDGCFGGITIKPKCRFYKPSCKAALVRYANAGGCAWEGNEIGYCPARKELENDASTRG
jgi:hypothetical protein